jgi:hypothetical protein
MTVRGKRLGSAGTDSARACDDALMDRSLPKVPIDFWHSITVGD